MNTLSVERSRGGSALVIALIMVAVLVSLGAATFIAINDKYRVVHQAASWEEALHSAEAGVEIGLTELRKPLVGGTAFVSDGWTQVGAGGKNVSKTQILRSGEGGNNSWTVVRCDVPFTSSNGEPWWRIRAHGYCRVPGGRISAGGKMDAKLRKLSLNGDRYSTQADSTGDEDFHLSAEDLAAGPVAHRAVEAIVRPMSAFQMALFGNTTIDFTDHQILVDSYDSRDNTKSTDGAYDPAKRTWRADIGTNGDVINAKEGTVYGTANTNGGLVNGDSNIKGHFDGDPDAVRDDFSMDVGEVIAPSTTEEPTTTAPTDYSGITTVTQIPGETVGATSYDHVIQAGDTYTTVVRLSSVDLQNKTLFIKGVDGKTTDAHIIVSGDITVGGGQGAIILDTGVRVRIFVGGDVDIAGQGLVNTGTPLNLQLYGLTRNANDTVNVGSMKIAGNGGISAAIYAPNYDVTINGGGTDTKPGDFYGSIVGRYVKMTGHTSLHYDEALGEGGLVAGYKIVSWFEDER